MSKVIVLSGGMDSAVLLSYELSQGEDVYPLTFKYGQKHSTEINSAVNLCTSYGLADRHKVVDISSISSLFDKGSLSGDEEIPEGSYDDDNMTSTIVPNRNMVMLALATSYAVTIGADSVSYAAHKGDHTIYPDCTPEFAKAMNLAISIGNAWTPVELEYPFINKTKGEIASLGIELDTPFEVTWSCYNGGDRPCLKCGTCIERTEAFYVNGFPDPSLYSEEWKQAVVEMLETLGDGVDGRFC